MLTILVVALYAAAVFIDFLPGIGDRGKKANIIYCVMMSLSFCVLILYSLGIQIPSPTEPIKDIVNRITGI